MVPTFSSFFPIPCAETTFQRDEHTGAVQYGDHVPADTPHPFFKNGIQRISTGDLTSTPKPDLGDERGSEEFELQNAKPKKDTQPKKDSANEHIDVQSAENLGLDDPSQDLDDKGRLHFNFVRFALRIPGENNVASSNVPNIGTSFLKISRFLSCFDSIC